MSYKDTKSKPRLDLIPYIALEEIAKVFTYGIDKYGEHKYKKEDIKVSELVSAAMRHLGKFNDGRDIDESEHLHLAHCASNLCMLLWIMNNRLECDDRWKK